MSMKIWRASSPDSRASSSSTTRLCEVASGRLLPPQLKRAMGVSETWLEGVEAWLEGVRSPVSEVAYNQTGDCGASKAVGNHRGDLRAGSPPRDILGAGGARVGRALGLDLGRPGASGEPAQRCGLRGRPRVRRR